MGNSVLLRLRGNLQNKNEEIWWVRVKENARAFFELRGAPALAHGGAFDLLEGRAAAGTRKRQAVSLFVHAVVIGGLILAGRHVMKEPKGPGEMSGNGPLLFPPLKHFLFESKPDPGGGKGSNHDLLPATKATLPPLSPVALIRPHLPDDKHHALPVAPTVYDADAAMPVRTVIDMGLPWMQDRNGSNGKEGGNTIGTKRGDTIGSSDGDYEGESGGLRYVPGMYPARCVYCPDPEYTDEARHAKTQGSVLLRVLVSADGRASQVKIMQGIGLGLDERAAEKVRTWRFEPARDANKRAIAQWATIEVTYRLF